MRTYSVPQSLFRSYAYDNANRLLSIEHKGGSTTFASFDYDYNSVGNRTSVTREDGTSDLYDYDPTQDCLIPTILENATEIGS